MKIIAIDATSIVNTGGFTHLYHLLDGFNKKFHPNIEKIIIFSSRSVLERLPDKELINKQTHYLLNKKKLHRLFFQLFLLDSLLKKNKVDFLLSITGDYVGSFRPFIGISQNMLLHEKYFWEEIKSIKEKTKLFINYKRQKKCFKSSAGIIFISEYAKNFITKELSLEHKPKEVIYHGVSKQFYNKKRIYQNNRKILKFIYVSTVHVYKNQCNVIDAIWNLRQNGIPASLTLIGQIIYAPSGQKLFTKIKEKDPYGEFIEYIPEVSYDKLPSYYSEHDAVIFASSCENMPNILIESMASGLPIVCSDKQPMPEFLKEGGYYFNPISEESIRLSILKLIRDTNRFKKINQNLNEASKLKWEETSKKTFSFIEKLSNKYV